MWRRAFDRVLCSGVRPCRIFVGGYVVVGGPGRLPLILGKEFGIDV